ncbi:hypothetical protein Pla52n_56850 [Stieleria varia]|uniref:Uncharacterized protein n=1 Tax=Stieleria varia TaxID=2528005 RepID=A0A5C6A3E2_9BACT|nr:hypothetical protein Pla52n_56850 [Stieleria varia]
MSENPYAPPKLDVDFPELEIRNARQRLRLPATIILLLASFHAMIDLTGLLSEINSPRSGMQFIGMPEYSILLTAHLLQIAGCFCVLRLSNYRLAYRGAILACIPILSPLLVVGIPFGVVLVTRLRQTENELAFDRD